MEKSSELVSAQLSSDPEHPPVLVGLLGGLGPASSAAFTQRMVQASQEAGATKDENHAPFILYSNPRLPNARLAALGQGSSPLPGYVATFKALVAAGCTHVSSINNTGHAFAREAAQEVGVAFIDMIQCTAQRALRWGLHSTPQLASAQQCPSAPAHQAAEDVPHTPKDTVIHIADTNGQTVHQAAVGATRAASPHRSITVGLLATDATINMGLYHEALITAATAVGGVAVSVVCPSPAQLQAVQSCIDAAKAGRAGAQQQAVLTDTMASLVLQGCCVIVAGCTELPLMLPWGEGAGRCDACTVPVVDPLACLADAVTALSNMSSSP